ncbi:hypothetical protein RIF29_35305 [Crotalaria pallida]|uniref:F-box domain-containing protein n=1 Tax=Crotalaria pallida TaxID=3830 RepID=A0AAN9EA79_CROPI
MPTCRNCILSPRQAYKSKSNLGISPEFCFADCNGASFCYIAIQINVIDIIQSGGIVWFLDLVYMLNDDGGDERRKGKRKKKAEDAREKVIPARKTRKLAIEKRSRSKLRLLLRASGSGFFIAFPLCALLLNLIAFTLLFERSSDMNVVLCRAMISDPPLLTQAISGQRASPMEEEDRISSLPDEVLCHILSFLPTKEAVATSAISKRWYPLWRSVTILDINDEFVPQDDQNAYLRYREFVLRYVKDDNKGNFTSLKRLKTAVIDDCGFDVLLETLYNVKFLYLDIRENANVLRTMIIRSSSFSDSDKKLQMLQELSLCKRSSAACKLSFK